VCTYKEGISKRIFQTAAPLLFRYPVRYTSR